MYLVKVRDRFLTHPRNAKVVRSPYRGHTIQDGQAMKVDIIGANQWSQIDQLALGENALVPGSQAWQDQRRTNEDLIRSSKKNEDFTLEEILKIEAAGTRECDLDVALSELSTILETKLLPLVRSLNSEAVFQNKWFQCDCGEPYP